MIPTATLVTTFADLIETYLHHNDLRRQTIRRYPAESKLHETNRNKAYHQAQQANTALHQHLLKYTEPDYLMLHARQLIEAWDARNTCWENLRSLKNDPTDTPKEAIRRLNKAEHHLRQKLQEIKEILKKLATN